MPNERTVTPQSKRLGAMIRKAREKQGMSLRALADVAKVNFAHVSKVEAGYYASPKPEMLQRISRALDIPLEDLYAEAGYARTEGLPTLPVYLRSKYGLTVAEAAEVEAQFRQVAQRRSKKGGGHAKRST